MAGRAQPRAFVGRPAILPDDRAGDRLHRPPVPKHERLSLIRDAHGPHVARPDAGRVERLARACLNRGPDLGGVVLDPAGPRIVLGDLCVALAAYLTVDA